MRKPDTETRYTQCNTITTLLEQYAVRESEMWIALPDGEIMAEEDFKKR